jgi:hypothetical protein
MLKPKDIKDDGRESRDRWADNVAPHSRHYDAPREDRERLAGMFGPNWASVMAGHGDQ